MTKRFFSYDIYENCRNLRVLAAAMVNAHKLLGDDAELSVSQMALIEETGFTSYDIFKRWAGEKQEFLVLNEAQINFVPQTYESVRYISEFHKMIERFTDDENPLWLSDKAKDDIKLQFFRAMRRIAPEILRDEFLEEFDPTSESKQEHLAKNIDFSLLFLDGEWVTKKVDGKKVDVFASTDDPVIKLTNEVIFNAFRLSPQFARVLKGSTDFYKTGNNAADRESLDIFEENLKKRDPNASFIIVSNDKKFLERAQNRLEREDPDDLSFQMMPGEFRESCALLLKGIQILKEKGKLDHLDPEKVKIVIDDLAAAYSKTASIAYEEHKEPFKDYAGLVLRRDNIEPKRG